MRLKKSKTAAEEELILLMNEGHKILHTIRKDLGNFFGPGIFSPADSQEFRDWTARTVLVLNSIFPTELEANRFLNIAFPLPSDLYWI